MCMNMITFYLLLLYISIATCIVVSKDGSVCFNNCNEHGECIDYSCHCYTGYHGDDCSTTFLSDDAIASGTIIPILGAGDYNVTRKNITNALVNNKYILVGFSSYTCHKCIQYEGEYDSISKSLVEYKIPFARGDINVMKDIVHEFGIYDVPALVLFYRQRPLQYHGYHKQIPVIAYIEKQLNPPVMKLKTVDDVHAFIASRNSTRYSITTIMVIGFFSKADDVEEDDYSDLIEVAKDFQANEDIYIGVSTNPKTSNWFKSNKFIDRTPSLMLINSDGTQKTINFDEFYGNIGCSDWIIKNSIPLVGKLTSHNFKLYEKQTLPMLMLFLDLKYDDATSTTTGTTGTTGSSNYAVGGSSGGIYNENLLEEFRAVAKEYVDSLLFVYVDGNMYEDQMKSLGLFGGKERLPSIAFNTRDRIQITFPEELPINRDTLVQFCAEFISGKLKSKADVAEMAKKALSQPKKMSQKNQAKRKAQKSNPVPVVGVSEQFGDGSIGDKSVLQVTLDTFDAIVMNEDKDVLVMFHAASCEPCSHLSVYYKRMASRFEELNISSLTIARMDITNEAAPSYLDLSITKLPLVMLVPAHTKHPPWNIYSGVGKMQPMMKWISEQVSIPFVLPNLPHLNDDSKDLYKRQVREREEAMDRKRRSDMEAMNNMDIEREKTKAKNAESVGIDEDDEF